MKYIASLMLAALGGGTLQAVAQSSGERQGLEEVVVTATRREESVQDVPLAVTAFSQEDLKFNNIENLEDITGAVPNVLVTGGNFGPYTASVNMRGIPNVGIYVDGIWQVSSDGLLLREFVDIERMEVLRGPQGTLYGRDSTGGSIHFYTAPPSDEFDGEIELGLGSYDRREVKGRIDLPITENLQTRWTVGSYNRGGFITSRVTGLKNGSFDDEVLRGDVRWTPSERLEVRLVRQEDTIELTQPRTTTSIDPRIAYVQGFQVGISEAYDIASGGGFNNLTAVSGYPGGEIGEYENRSEFRSPNRQWMEQTTLALDFDVTDSLSFSYRYGKTDVDSRYPLDWDGTEFNFFVDYNLNRSELESHEIQLSGGNDRISWVGGYYLWDDATRSRDTEYAVGDWAAPVSLHPEYGRPQTLDYQTVLDSPSCQMTPADRGVTLPNNQWRVPCNGGPFGMGWVGILAPGAGDIMSLNETSGDAIFGEVTLHFSDRFDLTLGYRRHEQTEQNWEIDIPGGIASGITEPRPIQIDKEYAPGEWVYGGEIIPATYLTVKSPKNTGRFAATYHVTDSIMVYLGYGEGFNSGGVSAINDTLGRRAVTYEPETLENTEIGLRSDLLNGRLRFNATYFNTDWLGIQYPAFFVDRVTGTTTTSSATQNAAEANAEGVELEIVFSATDSLTLQANLGFLDTGYVGISPSSAVPNLTEVTEFGRAPEETYNFSIQHNADLPNGGVLSTRLNANYWGGFWKSPSPELRESTFGFVSDTEYDAGDYWVLNGRMTYQPAGSNYEIALWGTNLLEEYIVNSGFTHGIWQFGFSSVDRPREFGLSLSMFF